jgi:hypothetical protein
MDAIATLSAAAALAWASGMRLYLVLFVLGALGRFGTITLPEHLVLLSNDWVLTASALMTAMEFFADKIPLVDSLWDAVHTFIRIPAGAVLAASTMGFDDPALTMVAAMVGGAITSGSHLSKAGARALVNTSPEPFTNWATSLTEDGMVLGGLWLAYAFPWVFLALLLLFLILVALLLPRLLRVLRTLLQRVAILFSG